MDASIYKKEYLRNWREKKKLEDPDYFRRYNEKKKLEDPNYFKKGRERKKRVNKKLLPGFNQERHKRRLSKNPKYYQKYIDERNLDPERRKIYLQKQREYYKTRKTANPDINKIQYKKKRERINSDTTLREKYLEACRRSGRKTYRKHKEHILNKDNLKRIFLVEYLGNKCTMCGYDENIRALVLDHINCDGHLDRKKLGSKTYRYYINNLEEAKEKLQVLCANCNMIKQYELKEHNYSRRIKEDL